jgi:uroporphyrinogen-III decarboxylase
VENSISDRQKSTISNSATKDEITHNPCDPKSWWMAYAAQRPRWIPIMAPMAEHAQHLTGIPARTFYGNATVNVHTLAALAAYYGFDNAMGVGDTYNYEAEALGQSMVYSENAMPTVDSRHPLIMQHDDLKKIKIPDWLNAGRIRFVLDLIKLNAELGMAGGKFCAPFSLAVNIRSYPLLIKDLRKHPEFAHDLFTFLVDEILPSYLKLQKEHCGISAATAPDAWSAFPNLSPELAEKWVVPYAEKLFKNCLPFDVKPLVAGSFDYCEERIEKFDRNILFKCFDIQTKLSFGMPMVLLGMGRWHEYPLEPVLEYLARYKDNNIRAIVMAQINARLLRDGPIDTIISIVKRFIDRLGRDHNLTIIMSNVPADTPPRHIHAAVAAVHTYGRLPLAENLDRVEFRVPERESFQEYIHKMSEGRGLGF